MKNKKNLLGIFFMVIVVGAIVAMGYYSRGAGKVEAAKVKEVPVSFEPITSYYFYEQLSEREKEIYADITGKLDKYEGGEIRLEEPISIKSLDRIIDTIRSDGERKYWYFVVPYCFNKDNMSILTSLEQSEEALKEKSISKILIQIDLGENQKKLDNFKLEYDKKNIVKLTNYEEFRTILEETKPEEGYYFKIDKEIIEIEQQIIDGMPKDITQEEAVQYVSDWMLNNMDYDNDMLKISSSSDYTLRQLIEVMESDSKACVVKKKGLCGGLSAFMADVYNKIGIDAKSWLWEHRDLMSRKQLMAGFRFI